MFVQCNIILTFLIAINLKLSWNILKTNRVQPQYAVGVLWFGEIKGGGDKSKKKKIQGSPKLISLNYAVYECCAPISALQTTSD